MRYELYHHGILGMRWGVRRFQNKDGSLTPIGRKRLEVGSKQYKNSKHGADVSISNSTKLYRIGGENETNDSGPKHTYVVTSKDDYYRYASVSGEGISGRTKYTFNSTKDLKIAGYKAQADALIDLYSSTRVSDIHKGMFLDTRYSSDKDTVKLSSDIIRNAFKDDQNFNKALRLVGQNLMTDSKTSEQFKSYLKKKGYDGLVDMNDDEFADLPVYLFDRSTLVEKGKQEVSKFDREYMDRKFGDDW